jgi:hypothetical protein
MFSFRITEFCGDTKETSSSSLEQTPKEIININKQFSN